MNQIRQGFQELQRAVSKERTEQFQIEKLNPFLKINKLVLVHSMT